MKYARRIFPANGIRICVDEYHERDLSGRIYSKLMPQPLVFQNCGEMLLKADSMFDEKGYPQAFQRKRTFSEKKGCRNYCARPPEFLTDRYIQEKEGRRGTFDVIVHTRKKAGWQGYFRNVSDSGKTVEFRSELEMLKLLDGKLLIRAADTLYK